MADDLYDQDFYLWTQAQAAALRARAGGNALDYEHLAEEVEDLGSAQRNKAESFTRLILQNLYKLAACPEVQPVGHWRVEIENWRADLEQVLTGAIRRDILAKLDRIHARAARIAATDLANYEATVQVDAARRWTLAQILGEDDDSAAGAR
ncbi:MAG: DUF29 family protein [Caulobacteraceae bacterium]